MKIGWKQKREKNEGKRISTLRTTKNVKRQVLPYVNLFDPLRLFRELSGYEVPIKW